MNKESVSGGRAHAFDLRAASLLAMGKHRYHPVCLRVLREELVRGLCKGFKNDDRMNVAGYF